MTVIAIGPPPANSPTPPAEPPGPPDSWRYSLQLSHSAHAPGIARSTVRVVLHEHGLSALTDTAELLTSELVTNSYRYTDGEIFLRLRWNADVLTLRLSVWDANPEHPATTAATAPPDPHRTKGRGLFLVRHLADRWGVHDFSRECRGKATWVELNLD